MIVFENVVIDVFSLTILLVIFLNMYSVQRKYLPDQKLFFAMVFADAVMLVMDAVQWISNGEPGRLAYYVNVFSNFIYFTVQPLPYAFWCFYVRYEMTMDYKEMTKNKALMLIPFYINTAFVILTYFNGYYYYIDSQNCYTRGNLFLVSVLLVYMYFIYSLVYVAANRGKTERHIYISLLFFALPPIVASVVQMFNFGFSLIWPGVTLSLLMIYLNIQKNQLYTDYLTGLYNRRLFDIHLRDYLLNGPKKDRFGVLMLDIDKFKSINDKFGHVAGDQALVEAANIIKKSIGKSGFAARYGGDEFVVIIPAKSLTDIDAVAKNIDRNIISFNKRENALYDLRFSMGYELFNCGDGTSANDVINIIDRRMYKEKKLNHELAAGIPG